MADNKKRGRFGRGADDESSSIFDLFEPPPDSESSSLTRIPIIRDDDDMPLDLTASEAAGAQAAAEAEAAGLAHWTEPPTGQLPAALAGANPDDRWAELRGPSWQGEEPNWAGPDLSDVFADTDPISHRRVVEDDEVSIDPAPTMPPHRLPAVRAPQGEAAVRAAQREAATTGERRLAPRVAPEQAPVAPPVHRQAPPVPPPVAAPAPRQDHTVRLPVQGPDPGPSPAVPGPRAEQAPRISPPSVFGDTGGAANPPPPPSRPRPVAPTARPRVNLEADVPVPPTAGGRGVAPSPPIGSVGAPVAPPVGERSVLGRGTISVDEALNEVTGGGFDEPSAPARPPAQTAMLDGRPSDDDRYEDYDYDANADDDGRRGLGQRVAVGVGLAALVLATLSLGPDVTMVLVGLIALLAVMELFNTMRIAGLRPATLLGLVGTVAFPVAAYIRGETAYPLVVGVAVVFGMLWYLAGADTERPVLNLGLTFTGILWIGSLAGFAALMMRAEEGVGLLLTAIIVTSVSDTMAYLGGRAYGTRPFHSASPNKTWEGTLTGFFGALLAGLIIWATGAFDVFDGQFVSVMVMAAAIGILAPIGDLAESLVKRDLGVKDMGHLLPGHGGVLDRIDGLLFALPATYYVAVVFELI